MRPEVTSGLATGAAMGVWNLSSARSLQTEQLLWNAATGHLTETQASGTPLCRPGRGDKSTPVPDKLNYGSLEERCRDRPTGDSDVLHSPRTNW